jgi:polyisoprenoid-binding protein YceI
LLGVFAAALLAGDPTVYRIDPAASRIVVHVGKSGIFGFAGHEHQVFGAPLDGTVRAAPDDLAASSVSLRFRTADFNVVAAHEPDGDAPKVQQTMETRVLEIERFPMASFDSSQVTGRETGPGRYSLEITGILLLHGVSRTLRLPAEATLTADTLEIRGATTIKHRDFDMKRVSAGAGTVKVADDIRIEYSFVARRAE